MPELGRYHPCSGQSLFPPYQHQDAEKRGCSFVRSGPLALVLCQDPRSESQSPAPLLPLGLGGWKPETRSWG